MPREKHTLAGLMGLAAWDLFKAENADDYGPSIMSPIRRAYARVATREGPAMDVVVKYAARYLGGSIDRLTLDVCSGMVTYSLSQLEEYYERELSE